MTITTTDLMTSRERILAALEGREVDRFPVWLKMANQTWQSAQPEPYRSMDGTALLEAAGCDVMIGSGVRVSCERPHAQRRTEEHGDTRRTITQTPDGELVGEQTRAGPSAPWHPTKYPVETPEALRALRWFYADTRYSVSENDAEAARAKRQKASGRNIATFSGIGPGPLMDLIQHISGPVQTIYLLADEPALFRDVHQIMAQDWIRRLKAQVGCPSSDSLWMTENTSTTLLSPALFEEFCMPYLRTGGELIRDSGMVPVHHMCGKLNALLALIDTLPPGANEAYTTRPLGDVSLAEGRRRMPSRSLIGGTNATLWLEPADRIVEEVARDLADCPDRRKIFLTSAGVLPPPVPFEKARTVVEALKRL
jgi:uroporphyrinogen-III decarboxylase